MRASKIDDRLLRQSTGEYPRKQTKVRDFFGDRAWVDDLDIINELGGHTGCVNALR
jgi:DDB1- and CUL4-associated factor 6